MMDLDEVQVEIEVTPGPDEQAHLALAAQFNPFPFTLDARNEIFARRSLMSDELVFDLLLEQASIASPQSLFPPDSPETLLDLFDAIAKCPWDTLKKWCLHFYLLSYVSPDAAAKHATACALPPQFEHLAHACFLLDSGSLDDLARAVALLSDARIVQDLSSKILHTLSLAPQPVSSRLVRTYVQTAQPVLEAYEDLAIYLRALMECSLADAWTFQRTFSETTPLRNQLFRTILDGCLIPPKPSVLPHLLSLPLTSFEFSLLQSYALSPPEELTPAAHSILQDLIAVRLLHSGKYSDAIRLSRAFDMLNAKSRTGTTAALRKAAEERQQMMRDVLAVVPEVQRRQLELEVNDEQGDVEATSLGASWASMGGSDVSMSWENLGASGSAKARDKAGRLEGSPAPKLPGRANAPFGLFSSPAGSPQKRKASGNVTPTNIFGAPTSAKTIPAVLPMIPTPGLAMSTAKTTPPILSSYRHSQRFDFVTLQTRQPATPQNGIASTSATQLGVGLNSRNAFFEPGPERVGTSLFGSQSRADTSPLFARRTRYADGGSGSRRASAGRQSGPLPVAPHDTLEDDREQGPQEDAMMIDSDDPDSFLVRGRRRTLARSLPQAANANAEPTIASVNGVRGHGAALFGRRDDGPRKTDHVRDKGSPKAMVVPGGFTNFELDEQDASAPSHPPNQPDTRDQRYSKETSPRRSRTRPRRNESSEPGPRQLKIPGALFDNEDVTAHDRGGREEQDSVPSLPSLPAKGPRRTRGSRPSGAMELADDDDAPKKSLRRSSRLSSTGASPEPSSPQKPEKKPMSKRPGKASSTSDGTGRSTRNRKSTVQ